MNKAPQVQENFFNQNSNQYDQTLNEEIERQKENENANFGKMKLKDLFPVNFLGEKDKFFELGGCYNPHFVYKTIVFPEPLLLSTQYEELALKILKSSPPYQCKIPYLNQQQVRAQVQEYLDSLGLKDYVELKMEFQCLSRTSVVFYKNRAVLKMRTPLTYTPINLQGVLNHEIGTHVLRTLNHKQNCVRKPSEKGKMIEQGLAALNQLLPQQKPFLFKPALRYVAAIYASKMSFSEMYKMINKFVGDQDQCWRECVRVKRGLGNTQQKGGFYKDQTYLLGAIEVLKERQSIDFEKIYYGKLAPEETKNLTVGVLPPFLGTPEKLSKYKMSLQKIALCNFIDHEMKSI